MKAATMKEKQNPRPLIFHPSAFILHPCFQIYLSLIELSLMERPEV